MSRIPDIQHLLGTNAVDAALLTHPPDVRWACGFTGSNGMLVVQPSGAHLVTDGRYAEQAADEVRGASVDAPGYDLIGYVAERGWLGEGARVLIQGDRVTVAERDGWAERLPGCTLVPRTRWMAPARAAKTAAEVEQIRTAQAVTDAVFGEIVGLLRPGVTEREVAAEIVYRHLLRGADKMAFDPIVASGPQGALPHARPTDRVLQSGELVVLDFGCVLGGYASDMTRTVALGEPGDEARAAYAVVLRAQRQALAAARSGITTNALDAAARGVIEDAGLGSFFSHGLGHGIGLETHEWPHVSRHTDAVMPEGTTVTIEPGVYLPGRFGIRIEDIVVLRQDGCENLTAAPKDLLVL